MVMSACSSAWPQVHIGLAFFQQVHIGPQSCLAFFQQVHIGPQSCLAFFQQVHIGPQSCLAFFQLAYISFHPREPGVDQTETFRCRFGELR